MCTFMMMVMIRLLLIHKNAREQSINRVKRRQGKSTYNCRNLAKKFYTTIYNQFDKHTNNIHIINLAFSVNYKQLSSFPLK